MHLPLPWETPESTLFERAPGVKWASGHPLPGGDRDGQPVSRRSERTAPARVVRARRVVGEVEVEHEPAVVGAEVGALDRVQQVAPGAVGRLAAGRVREGN